MVPADLGDNDDGAVEIADWRATGAAPAASVAASGPDGAVMAACLVSRDSDGTLWISYVITDPAAKGKGSGPRGGHRRAAPPARLRSRRAGPGRGERRNTPSERLLVRRGFQRRRAV